MTPVGGGGLWTRRLTGIEAPAPMTPVGAVPPHPWAAKGRPYGKARRVVAQASFISAQEPPLCGGWPRNAPAGAISARWADSPSRAPQAGSGGLTVQAPLERGLLPPKAVTGGFLSPAGAVGKNGGRNPPSRLRRAASLFKGGFWGGGHCPPLRIGERGRELYVFIQRFPKIVPRHAKKRAECTLRCIQLSFSFREPLGRDGLTDGPPNSSRRCAGGPDPPRWAGRGCHPSGPGYCWPRRPRTR